MEPLSSPQAPQQETRWIAVSEHLPRRGQAIEARGGGRTWIETFHPDAIARSMREWRPAPLRQD